MFNPFIVLISKVISLINIALIVWIVLGLLIHFDIVNRNNPLINRIQNILDQLFEPVLRPIRARLAKFMPALNGIDLSPVVLILLLNFINDALFSWFYKI